MPIQLRSIPLDNEKIERSVRRWVESFVVGFNLCPFAGREISNNRVRFVVTSASSREQLVLALQDELELLTEDAKVETTLLIHPQVLQDFSEYNEFLGIANALLIELELEGVFQIASFHPRYQFEGTDEADAENFSNRAPYPVLHLIREASVERAVAEYPDIDLVPARNIERMNSLGREKLHALLQEMY